MNIKIPSLVQKTLDFIKQNGYEIYIVGGSVRDLLISKKVKDWDFTTSAKPEQIQELSPESFYDNKFGTVGVTVEELLTQFNITDYDLKADNLKNEDVFEITTFRTDGDYRDGRRPETVTWGKTLEEDLKRRDFTINALALKISTRHPDPAKREKDPVGENQNQIFRSTQNDTEYKIIDLYNGQKDLEDKLIRAVGDPQKRFEEDALRLLRAVRMASQLGFLIEEKTLKAISDNADKLANISNERIRDELLKIITAQYSADGLKMLLSTGLLHFVLPEMEKTVGIEQAGHHTKDVWNHSIDSMQACPSPDPIVKLATLIHDVGKPIAYRKNNNKITFYGHEVISGRIAKKIGERLHLSNDDKERLFIFTRYHMFAYQPEMTDAAIRRFIRKVGLENINNMMMLRIGDRVGGGSKQTSWRLRELQQRIGQVLYTPMQIKDLKVNGSDVMEILDIKGGPKVGQVLKTLFDEVMEDSEKNDREYLLKRIKQLKDK